MPLLEGAVLVLPGHGRLICVLVAVDFEVAGRPIFYEVIRADLHATHHVLAPQTLVSGIFRRIPKVRGELALYVAAVTSQFDLSLVRDSLGLRSLV
jgi:hypothetical protein